jgi:ADP-ribosylglycohydrolase
VSKQLSLNLEDKKYQDKFRGAFVGAAIGDALGFITEFMRSPSDIRSKYNLESINKFIRWGRITTYQKKGQYIELPLLPGTYSDDTQLTLATARSIESDGSFNPETFSKYELPLWLEYELGGGSGTKAAARNLYKKDIKWYNNFYYNSFSNYVHGGGNGAAMRILPIALVNITNRHKQYFDIWRNTIITHGNPKALIGAILLADCIRLIIDNPTNKLDWIEQLVESCIQYPKLLNSWREEEVFRNWEQNWSQIARQEYQVVWQENCRETLDKLKLILSNFDEVPLKTNLEKLGCYNKETKGAGDSTVIAAILFICRLTNCESQSFDNEFENTVVSIVNNIGIDTDTIAYFAGAIIGAQYGFEAIPDNFKHKVQDYGYLLKVADWCYDIYEGTGKIKSLFSYPDNYDYLSGNSIELAFNEQVINGKTVNLPVFGNTKIIHYKDITPYWLKKSLYWLHLELNFKQTIFVKTHLPYANLLNPKAKSLREASESYVSQEESIVSSLPALEEFKTQVESSNFDAEVILKIIKQIKFEKKNRAIYSAFTTWLWSALPSSGKT